MEALAIDRAEREAQTVHDTNHQPELVESPGEAKDFETCPVCKGFGTAGNDLLPSQCYLIENPPPLLGQRRLATKCIS